MDLGGTLLKGETSFKRLKILPTFLITESNMHTTWKTSAWCLMCEETFLSEMHDCFFKSEITELA